MSVKIRGIDKLARDLEARYGKARMQPIIDTALKAGAAVFVEELKRQFEDFKDTGHSMKEIDVTEPYDLAGVRTIKVRWKGPKGRFRIVHLNEFGTVKNPNPRGKGAIARTLANTQQAYRKALREALKGAV